MPRAVRRPRGAVVLAVPQVVLLAAAIPVAAVDDAPEPTTGRCVAADPAEARTRGIAALPGWVAATNVLQTIPECAYPVEPSEGLEPRALVRLLDRVSLDQVHVVRDGGDDVLTLDGGPVEGTPDPALQIEALRYGSGAIGRNDVADGSWC